MQIWLAAALGIGGLTLWGNIEFWRRRRRGEASATSDISAFSDTIDDWESRPLIHPDGLEIRRRER
jgi:hypothetical protein